MIVSIHQPNYLPWLGYFRKLLSSDVFVFFDNVQMPMGKSYVARVEVKTATGRMWLTVPTARSSEPPLIRDAQIVPGPWARKHLATLKSAYGGSRWLAPVSAILEDAGARSATSIANLNVHIITAIADWLAPGRTRLVRASQMQHGLTGSESIAAILAELQATVYLTGSGKGTMRHIEPDRLAGMGVETSYLNVEFPTYSQRYGEFAAGLSIVDALLSIGPEATLQLLLPK